MGKGTPHILVVDDDLSMREFLELMLSREGYRVTCAASGKGAIAELEKRTFDLLLCDIRLGDMIGLDVLRKARQLHENIGVIMISAYATTETAVEAMNEGAYDYVPKPFENRELKQTVATALELRHVEAEKEILNERLNEHLHFGMIVGDSPRMKQIYDVIRQVAETRANVLITGESGTGKELIAKAIHLMSPRRDNPFVVINCGGIPENLMESEFFGHKKGAFTGATHDKKGLFELADGGTVFLDEIGELSLALQVKLLRAVQQRVFKPVGGTQDVQVDIRIVSATNKNLEQEVIEGRFREDLFYRLNVVPVKVPPLRERKSDIQAIAQHFLNKYSDQMGKDIVKISSYAVEMLKKYDFPGNIRELENLIERSVALSSTNIILPESLSLSIHKRRWIEGVKGRRYDVDEVSQGVNLDDILSSIEKAYLERALQCAGGNKKRAAELVGLSHRSIRYRLEKLGIDDAGTGSGEDA
ncbi:MAG: Fis family transcriptional regulator [Deltaproteobacteria bacterium]|nr:MAG: Fis family transcriptional regulator [Deltaproteobacteria bacterium]